MSDPRFVRADEPIEIAEGDTYTLAGKPLALDFTSVLGSATISTVATPTVTPSGSLTVDGKQANAGTYTDADGATVAVGKAVLFAVSGQSSGVSYVIRFDVTDSDSEVRSGEVRIEAQ